jgi:uncharacterized protein (DUF1330 family)
MKGYLVAQVEIEDRDGFGAYAGKAAEVVKQYEGRFLVSTGKVETREGDRGRHRLVVLEFPSLEAARVFYDSAEYQEILPLRLRSSRGELFIAEGFGD